MNKHRTGHRMRFKTTHSGVKALNILPKLCVRVIAAAVLK